MSGFLFEALVILLLVVANGLFAMSELAVMTARRTRLEHRAEEGDAGAAAALALAANPGSFLSTVQIGITLIGVLAGAFGGAGLAERLAARLAQLPALAEYADALALALVVAVITYLSLVIGELVPKQVALSDPERVAAAVARPMRVVARVGRPLVRLLTGSTNLVFRALGLAPNAERGVTEQDIRATVEQGAESGVLDAAEHEIIENAFRLGDRQVASLMTPRPDLQWVDVACDAAELRELLVRAPGEPILVCEDDVDHVLGVAHAELLFLRALAGEPFDLRAGLRPPTFVPGSMSALRLLEALRHAREQVAVVLDEYGGVQGVVTVDDLVEALVGELPEPGEVESAEIVREGGGSWLVAGGLPIEELEAELDLDARKDERRTEYRTVAGLVLVHLGRLPAVGDRVSVAGWSYEVAATQGRRVARVRVRPVRE